MLTLLPVLCSLVIAWWLLRCRHSDLLRVERNGRWMFQCQSCGKVKRMLDGQDYSRPVQVSKAQKVQLEDRPLARVVPMRKVGR